MRTGLEILSENYLRMQGPAYRGTGGKHPQKF